MLTNSLTDRLNWLNLIAIPGVGPAIFKEIRSKVESSEVVDYTDSELKRLGFNRRLRSLLLDRSCRELALQRAEKAMRWSDVPGHHLVFIDDPEYPDLLKHIPDPPAFLFVDGDLSALSANQIAMVGTRKPSPSGYDAAKLFAYDIAKQGYIVTSGLAYGIDAASHQGALQGGGKTIAVLGSGINVIYPKKHSGLAAQIRQNGAVISEFFPDVEPQKTFFPRRNRIISGLSMGVVVVEAAKKSGSLITAKMALEQGREICALPGSIFNAQSQGCHELIKQGANLVESVEDILHSLNGWLRRQPSEPSVELFAKAESSQSELFSELAESVESSPPKTASSQTTSPKALSSQTTSLKTAPLKTMSDALQCTGSSKSVSFSRSDDRVTQQALPLDLQQEGMENAYIRPIGEKSPNDIELSVLDNLDDSPASIDIIVQRSGLLSREVLVALLNLELKGLISHHAGGYCLSSATLSL